jgi:hypothetical protein
MPSRTLLVRHAAGESRSTRRQGGEKGRLSLALIEAVEELVRREAL